MQTQIFQVKIYNAEGNQCFDVVTVPAKSGEKAGDAALKDTRKLYKGMSLYVGEVALVPGRFIGYSK